jgi:hypothetical protein
MKGAYQRMRISIQRSRGKQQAWPRSRLPWHLWSPGYSWSMHFAPQRNRTITCLRAARRLPGEQRRKERTFFEKKKQKTFISLVLTLKEPIAHRSQPSDKSFLVLFFKKEHSFFPHSAILTTNGNL